MFRGPVARIAEFDKVANFLAGVNAGPSALVIGGEPGIGKSTLWQAGLQLARQSGMHVLSARAGESESVLALATVAELFSEVDPSAVGELPEVQRLAVGALARRRPLEISDGGPGANPHLLAAAMLSSVDALERSAPVLLAIDDLQWLDPSSQTVVGFVARRLRRRTALLLTERAGSHDGSESHWLHLDARDGLQRIVLGPLSLGGLHEVISQKLGRSFPRPTMVRIGEFSGGNPFFALELARTLDDGPLRGDTELPSSLAELVRRRIGVLSEDVREVLLVAASAADPTVELIAQVTGFGVDRTVELLEGSEAAGVLSVIGHRVRYSHPLLAHGVYAEAEPWRRRRVHRRLATVVTEPELRARHLALAAHGADPVTVAALDEGAVLVRRKGAPAEAAELLDLAIELGGDSPQRRIMAADNHFRAGDTALAQEVLGPAIAQLPAGPDRALARALQAVMVIYTTGYQQGITELQRALGDVTDNLMCRTFIRTLLAFAQVRAGRCAEATDSARTALAEATELGIDQFLSSALAVSCLVDCMCGRDYDHAAMGRALALEGAELDAPVMLSARAVEAVLLMCTGRVDQAATQLALVRDRLLDRGADTAMLWVTVNGAMLNILRGDYPEAAADARETIERAQRLGGEHVMSIGLTMRGAVAAYTGDEKVARADLRAAIDLDVACGSPHPHLASSMLAFLEVSVGAHAQALAAVEPMLAQFDAVPGAGFPAKAFLPDAVEALTALGQLERAEPLVAAVEESGRRLGQPWQLAVGARCRAMLLSASGELAEAGRVAAQAMTHHERLAMPFERARTQLMFGQLQRRQRRRRAAEVLIAEALDTFERLGAALWVQRAHAELGCPAQTAGRKPDLTSAERRVAELVASGMTNREVATELFISPKTVEANLTQAYRKLGIRSRAELGRAMGRADLG